MSFATCLNCMDGRNQLPVIAWIRESSRVDFVDMITEPGIVRLIASEDEIDPELLGKVEISRGSHGSERLFIVAHHDCAGNPVEDRVQIEQVAQAVMRMKVHLPSMDVIGLWVDQEWTVSRVDVTGADRV